MRACLRIMAPTIRFCSSSGQEALAKKTLPQFVFQRASMAGRESALRKKLCPGFDNCDLCKLLPDSFGAASIPQRQRFFHFHSFATHSREIRQQQSDASFSQPRNTTLGWNQAIQICFSSQIDLNSIIQSKFDHSIRVWFFDLGVDECNHSANTLRDLAAAHCLPIFLLCVHCHALLTPRQKHLPSLNNRRMRFPWLKFIFPIKMGDESCID